MGNEEEIPLNNNRFQTVKCLCCISFCVSPVFSWSLISKGVKSSVLPLMICIFFSSVLFNIDVMAGKSGVECTNEIQWEVLLG